jgi:hypothetical protein
MLHFRSGMRSLSPIRCRQPNLALTDRDRGPPDPRSVMEAGSAAAPLVLRLPNRRRTV